MKPGNWNLKKLLAIFIFISSISELSAQFFQGLGIMGGLSYYREKWWITNNDGSVSKIKQKYILRFNGCIFAEFIKHNNFHWRTELEYNQKGCIEKTPQGKFKNKVDYVCWNNYLKIYEDEFEGTPYLLIGPRVEYLIRQSTQSPLITSHFKPLHFSWSVGMGWEFVTYGSVKPIVEIHYNPDINKAYKTSDLAIINRPWELRVGIKIVFNKTSCPPVYK